MSEQQTAEQLTYCVLDMWASREEFERVVSERMRNGWAPIGNVTVERGEAYDTWIQAMVKL